MRSAVRRISRRFLSPSELQGEAMARETVPGVHAKLTRSAKRKAQKFTGVTSITPGIDGSKAARAAIQVKTNPSRDALLTNFGRATLQDRYLLPGEGIQDLFARVSRAYAD